MRARGRRFIAREVADALGLTVAAIHIARYRGQLRGTPTGRRHWHYDADAVEEYAKRYNPKPRYSARRPRLSPGPTTAEPTNPDPHSDDTPETKR